MKFKILFCLLILCLGASGTIPAQIKNDPKQDDDEVVRIDTQLVDVPIVVNDKNGRPLLNLKQNNFVVYEDGTRQEISDFNATTAPFEVAILLDTSGSTRNDLVLIQRAAENFIASLRPGDKVSIIAFKTTDDGKKRFPAPEVLSGLTGDRNALKAALAKVGTSNGTPYYDSVLEVVQRIFRDKPADEFRGRRALVALTDGVDSTSVTEFEEAREDIEKAGVVCFFIQIDTQDAFQDAIQGDCETATRLSGAQIRRYYRKFLPKASNVEKVFDFCQLGGFERMTISRKLYELADSEMNMLAKGSGGKVFPVADLSEARNAFKSVADEIGTKYSLGYYSSNEKRDGTYRKIRVELKGMPPGVKLRAREGYTAPVN